MWIIDLTAAAAAAGILCGPDRMACSRYVRQITATMR